MNEIEDEEPGEEENEEETDESSEETDEDEEPETPIEVPYKPRFSLKTMSHISYKPAYKILKDMFHEITESHFGLRDSWEILIEVLAMHLDIIKQPWLYSDPARDVEQKKQLSPLLRSAFWLEKTPEVLTELAILFGFPLRQPKLIQDQYHMSHEVYYDAQYRTVWKQYPQRYMRTADRAQKYFERFEKQGILQDYIEKARVEANGRGSGTICSGPDHLGAIFEEYMLAGSKNRLGQMLTPINVVDMMVMMLMGDKPLTRVEGVMEPSLGTGRMLIEYSRLNPQKPLKLYGVEVDLNMYHAALVNMAIYSQHPYAIICANTLALDYTQHPEVWNCANLWEPPDMNAFYYHYKPFKFSLKNLAEDRKLQSENSPTRQGIPVVQFPEAPQIPAFSLKLLAKELHG